MVFSSGEQSHGTGRHQMEVDARKALGKEHDKPLEARDLLPNKDGKDD